MIIPTPLIPDDLIAIAASARFVSKEEMLPAVQFLEQKGFRVLTFESLYNAHHQFAGTDHERTTQLQQLIDHPEVKAIWFARGGYGSARIVDQIRWDGLKKHPKWLIGFSDLTVFHGHVLKHLNLCTVHAPMALQLDPKNALHHPDDVELTLQILQAPEITYPLPVHPLNREGNTAGILTGGNLSVICSVLGSSSQPDFNHKILFLEDLDEYLYHIDRMMLNLSRNGILSQIKGLVVGGFTDMKDNAIPFGKEAEEIIAEHVSGYGYPVYFGFPAGHGVPNHPLLMGGHAGIENNILHLSAQNP